MRLRIDADDFRGLEIVGHRAHRLAPRADAQQQLRQPACRDSNNESHDLRLRQEERPEHAYTGL